MQVRFHSTTSQWWPLHKREVGMLTALEENRFASSIYSLAETILSGFWKYFPNLPVAHGNGDTLLKVVKQSGFSTIRFIGDSMSIQMGQHLACRYERFAVPFSPFSFLRHQRRKQFLDYLRQPNSRAVPPRSITNKFFTMGTESCIGSTLHCSSPSYLSFLQTLFSPTLPLFACSDLAGRLVLDPIVLILPLISRLYFNLNLRRFNS
jgi:hypothetical protein